ncbi:MAG: DUF2066 domain-containing protein [Alphaproteobacteria bacterium PRO2]|nr:DUF2066 domain-containing protein [Alphaproteobacteria bacterium PRO2]
MAIIYKTFRAIRTVLYAIFACFLLAPGPALAEADLFTVEGVQVDVTADSALAARDQAFDKAQVDAFLVLAGRMLSESELTAFTPPDAATVSPMVQDYEVTAEKLSSVRYIGTYTIRFRAAAVERFLNVQGQSYTNVSSAPLVILPFYQAGGRTYLWSPYNIWMRAWNRTDPRGPLVPVIVPMGDLEDVSDISDDDVFSYNPSKLANLLKRYDAGDAVIAVAAPDGNLARAREDDPANGAITVSLYRTDNGQPEHVREMVVEAQPGDTLSKLLGRAVGEVQTALKQNWKEKTVVSTIREVPPTGNAVVARVKIASLEEWARTQQSLARVNAITHTTLKSLSPREALVELSFRGDEEMLRQALAQAGMTLSHPKFAGYQSPTDGNHLVYDLVIGGRPAHQQYQPSSYQSPQPPGYQPSRPLPRDRIGDSSPSGYPIQPREQPQGYTGRF